MTTTKEHTVGITTQTTATITQGKGKQARQVERTYSPVWHADPNCAAAHEAGAVVLGTDDPKPEDELALCGHCTDVDGEIDWDIDPAEEVAFYKAPTANGSPRRANQYGTAHEPTERQVAFMESLIERKLGTPCSARDHMASLREGWTKRAMRKAIDDLLSMDDVRLADDQAPVAAANIKRNRFGGKCRKCNTWVEAEAGMLVGERGAWGVECLVCPQSAPTVADMVTVAAGCANTTVAEPPEGIHLLDGTIYKVQIAKQGSGRLYAKQLDVEARDHGRYAASWSYLGRQGAFHRLSADTLMTVEQAAEFGHLYGICGVCGADLTDEDSIRRGIGPVCASRL